jgi:pSer/pThr/pTyr-binding forkhead associated (FHA) protein/uncharacterized protein YegL
MLTAMLLLSNAAQGQPKVRVDGRSNRAIVVSKHRAKLYLDVREPSGRIVRRIPSENVSVTCGEDKTELPVAGINPLADTEEGVAVVVAIDTSGSMRKRIKGKRRIQHALPAAKEFLSQLKEQDRAAVVTFDSKVEVRSGFRDSPTDRIRKINEIKARVHGNTVLYDAIIESVKLLESQRKRHHRRAIVILTDGEDEGSTHDVHRAIKSARDAGVNVYGIGFVSKAEEFRELKTLCEKTRGNYLLARDPGDLREMYRDIGRRLRAIFVLEMKTDALPKRDKPFVCKVSIEVNGEKTSVAAQVLGTEPAGSKLWLIAVIVIAGLGLLLVVLYLVLQNKTCPRHNLKHPRSRQCPECAREADSPQQPQPPEPPKPPEQKPGSGAAPPGGRGAQPDLRPGLATLRVVDGPQKGDRFELSGMLITVGRSATSDVRLEDDTVSENHAQIKLVGDQYRLEDESSYGTKVNGKKVTDTSLEHGDEIKFGNVLCKYMDNRPAAPKEVLASFRATTGQSRGNRYEITSREATVGRDPGCEVTLNDDTVSSRHATLRLAGSTFQLEDHSTYGTKVNGAKIQTHALKDGDEVKFGNVVCKFGDLRR